MHASALPLVLLFGCLLLADAAGQSEQPGAEPRLPADHPKIGAAQPAKKAFDLAARAKSHWAWQPLRDPEVPPSSRYSHPVDRFLDAARRARGLDAAPRASRASLVRRAYFDVTGLPPSRAELERWQRAGDDFMPRLVDELLASRQYGEHWARHWLDLVRYSETMGHEFDYSIPNAWMYRDYLIRALNADVPYDQLVTEQAAVPREPVVLRSASTSVASLRTPPAGSTSSRPRSRRSSERRKPAGHAPAGAPASCRQGPRSECEPWPIGGDQGGYLSGFTTRVSASFPTSNSSFLIGLPVTLATSSV